MSGRHRVGSRGDRDRVRGSAQAGGRDDRAGGEHRGSRLLPDHEDLAVAGRDGDGMTQLPLPAPSSAPTASGSGPPSQTS